jgi:hypothetical protein
MQRFASIYVRSIKPMSGIAPPRRTQRGAPVFFDAKMPRRCYVTLARPGGD